MRKRILSLIMAFSMLCGLALNGHVLPVSASETDESTLPQIPIEQNFDDMTVDTVPTGWSLGVTEAEADQGKTSMLVKKKDASDTTSTDLVAAFVQDVSTGARSGEYDMKYNFEAADQVVLEYKYKTIVKGANTFLPVLTYEDGSYPVALYAVESYVDSANTNLGTVQKVTIKDARHDGTKMADAVALPHNTWHTVKEIVDLTNGVCELYMDGTRVQLTTFEPKEGQKLSSVTVAIYRTKSTSLYIDDLSVKTYVPATGVTFDQTALTLAVNEKAALKPTFAPADASVQSVTYTTSDDTVATVSANGIVTGVGGGTATITATPDAKDANGAALAATTINVTVNPQVVHEIPSAENFDALAVGTGIPGSWSLRSAEKDDDIGKNKVSVEADETDTNNKVLKLDQTVTRSGSYILQYNFEAADNVVLEYRYKASNVGYIYLPVLTYEGTTYKVPITLQTNPTASNATAYLTYGKDWGNAGPGYGIKLGGVQTANAWHTVKQVVYLNDNNERVCVLYFDGQKIALDSTKLNLQSAQKLSSVTVAVYSGTKGTIYIDDLSVKTYVPVDTEDELKAAILAGETEITLAGDITLTKPITVNKDVNISAASPVTVTVNIAEGKDNEAYGGFLVTNGTLTLGENITVTNNSPDDQGVSTIAATGANAKVVVNGATVTSATEHNAIEAANGSYVTIKSGHVYGQKYTAAYARGGATIKLEGGKVGHEDYNCFGLIASSTAATEGGNIEIAGGEVTYVQAHEAATSKVTVSGGTITKYVKADDKGNVTITGGTINEVRVSDTAGTVAISGGTFTITDNVSNYLADGFVLYGDTVILNDGTMFPIEVNFENGVNAETGLPKGWKLRYAEKEEDAGKTSAVVVAEDSNKVMKFAQTEKRDGWYMMQYDFAPTDQAVVFEYKYKVVSGTGILYMPSLAYNTTANKPSWSLLSYTSGGNFYYSSDVAGWASAANLKTGEWHTVKQIVDIPNKLCELYLDGERIELDTSKYKFTDDLTKLSCVTMFFDSGSNGTGVGEYYFDDFKLSFGIGGEGLTFAETALELPVGGAKTLTPQFNPPETSVRGITYTSDNPDVATVDSNGKVTAVGEGTAVITAKSVLDLPAVKIPVTVGGEIDGSISGTGSYELPVGGHTYLDASIEFVGGIEADNTLKYKTSNSGVVTVDEYGEVLAVGAGTVEITITSAANPDITETVIVTVFVPKVVKKIYVAPVAKGTGSGADADNATTLDDALIQLAAIDKENMTGNIEVILADGYYYRTEALKLTDAHGGSNLYSVTFKAADRATPTIGGGITIKGEDFDESEIEGVYVYDLKDLGLAKPVVTRSMFVDNVRAVRAKGEEAVYGESVLKNAEYLLKDGKKIGFVCENIELLDFDRIQDLEFVTKNNWTMLRGQVASVEEVDGKVHIIMDEHAFSKLSSGESYLVMRGDNVLYYENNLKLLDEPGEWYLDEGDQKLYYMPREWDNMETAIVTLPILDNWDKQDAGTVGLVTIIGSTTEKQAQNIRFEGITFADTTWSRSTERGAHTVQNNYLRDAITGAYSQKMADGAITVRRANGIQFLNCTFTRLGINAIDMYEGVQNSLVQGSHFYDISGAAIGIGQPDYLYDQDICNPTDVKKMMKNVDVLNNYIHDIAVEYMGAAAISVGFAVDVDISHNEIFHIPYSGMHIGYGWESKRETITKNLNVSENFIHDIMYDDIYDGGAVYTNGNTGGDEEHWNVITRNYFRNQGEKVAPMYSDTGSTWFKWTENVVDTSERLKSPTTGTGVSWAYIGPNASTDCQIIGNYYTVDKTPTTPGTNARVYVKDNILVADLNWPAEAQAIIDASGLEEPYWDLRNGQVERVVTDAPKGGVELSVNGTFALNARGTDGKDREVDTSEAIFVYESLDETKATVDSNGNITAVADGQTTVRIKVLSNSIVDIVEIPVIIGDEMVEIRLENVESIISLFENSREQQLVAYGVTKNDREVSLDTVEWYVDNDTVVTVENGLLKAVGIGEATLTVVGKRSGVTKTATYQIVVQQVIEAKVDYMEDIFLTENADKWYHKNTTGSWVLTEGERISAAVTNGKTYTGRTFHNELLTFRMSLDRQGTWPSIVLRSQYADKTLGYAGSTGYIICFEQNGIQLQRFIDGNRDEVFYGTITGFTPTHGENIKPDPTTDKQFHDIQVGAINEGNAVRLVLYIDGKVIFNILDTSENAITVPGYFGLVGSSGDIFVLEKINAPEISMNSLSLKGNIGVNYYTLIPDEVKADTNAKIRFTLADGTVVEKSIADGIKQDENGVNYYVFSCQVSAKEMGDDIKAQIFYSKGLSTEVNYYSVKAYADTILGDAAYAGYQPLIKAMLRYGALAQKQFGYKTYDLVTNVSYEDAELAEVTANTLKSYANVGTGTAKAKFYGTSLLLKSETTLRFFFQVDADANLKVTYGGTELEVTERDGFKYVDVENISAKDLDKGITLTVSDGTNTATVTGYPLGYCYNVLSNEATYGEPLVSLVKALYLYHKEATAKLNSN